MGVVLREVTFDVKVRLKTTVKELVFKKTEIGGDQAFVKEYMERSRRLQEAVLENDSFFKLMVLNEICSSFEGMEASELRTKYFGLSKDEDAQLLKAVETMSPEDKTFYKGVLDDGVFYENTEEIWRSFEPVIQSIQVLEVS